MRPPESGFISECGLKFHSIWWSAECHSIPTRLEWEISTPYAPVSWSAHHSRLRSMWHPRPPACKCWQQTDPTPHARHRRSSSTTAASRSQPAPSGSACGGLCRPKATQLWNKSVYKTHRFCPVAPPLNPPATRFTAQTLQ